MLVATVNSWKEPTSRAGRRLVSEKEWDLLQKEVRTVLQKMKMSKKNSHMSCPSDTNCSF